MSNKCIIFLLFVMRHLFRIKFFRPAGGAVMCFCSSNLCSISLLLLSRGMQASSPASVRVCSAALLRPPAGMRLRSALKSGEDTEVAWGHRGQVKSAGKTPAMVVVSAVVLQLPGDLQREGARPAQEEVHPDLQPQGAGAPARRPICGR